MGFPVDTADGSVVVVDKLDGGKILVAEDGTQLRPTTDALVSEVIEAVGADKFADVFEIDSEIRKTAKLIGDLFDGGEPEATGKEEADGDKDEKASKDRP